VAELHRGSRPGSSATQELLARARCLSSPTVSNMYLMIWPVLGCSLLFLAIGFFFDVFSFPWVSLVRGRGCSGGSGTRVEGVGLFRLARGRWYGASAQSRHAVELLGRGRTSFVCVLDLSCRLVFLGRGAAAPKWSWSRGLFRPMDWLAGGPGGGSMARWKQADESLLRFFACVSLSWSLGESFLIFRENEYC
jgi:hypothetical protein